MIPRSRRRRLFALVTGALAISIVALYLFRSLDRFVGAGHDDTWITILAAEQVAAGERFRTADGAPGEIASSLLHVLLLATFKLGGVVDLYLANKVFGLFCGAVTIGLVVRGRRLLFGASGPLGLAAASVAAFAPVTLPTYLHWMLGGLETPLQALWLTLLGLVLRRRHPERIAVVASLLVLTRPEGFVYVAAIAVFGAVMRPSRRWWAVAVGGPLAAFGVVTLWRYAEFGVPMPYPVLAKAAMLDRLGEGLAYIFAFSIASVLGGALVILAIGFSVHAVLLRGKVRSLGVLAVIGVHFGAIALAGGDWMAFSRFVAPIVPLLGVLVGRLFLIGIRGQARLAPIAAAIALLVLLAGAGERSGLVPPFLPTTSVERSFADLFDPKLGPALGERVRRLNVSYLRDIEQLEPFLEGPLPNILLKVKPHLVIATYQMGFFPHQIRALGLGPDIDLIDALGIADSKLARVAGKRTARGLEAGLEPLTFLDPHSVDPVPRAVLERKPDAVYVLEADPHTVQKLFDWGWLLMWNAPHAKVFVRRDLVERIQALTGQP